MRRGNDIGSNPIEWGVEFAEVLPPFEEQMKFSIETVTKTFQIPVRLIGANDNDNRYQPTGPVVDSTMVRGARVMRKYQSKSDPRAIVEAEAFDPHKHPWPDGVISWDGKPRPRDGSWGYIDLPLRRIHVWAGDYIVLDREGDLHAVRPNLFEGGYCPVIVIGDVEELSEKQVMSSDTQDLEAFMHRLLRSGVAPHDASREGLNYAISMIPPSMSAKEGLDTASRLLEQATKSIGISAEQLNEAMQENGYRERK